MFLLLLSLTSPTHVQSIRACLGCCWGPVRGSRVSIANLVCTWFGHLSLMSNRCLYSFCKWGECHWALLPEPGGDQLLLQIAAAVAERAEGVSSLSLILCCEPLAGPNSIAPQTPSHLLRTAISATKTPPVCSMRCFRLSHVSRDQRESHVYQKEYLKIIQKSKPSSHVSNHGKEICVNIAVYFLEFVFLFSCDYWVFFSAR